MQERLELKMKRQWLPVLLSLSVASFLGIQVMWRFNPDLLNESLPPPIKQNQTDRMLRGKLLVSQTESTLSGTIQGAPRLMNRSDSSQTSDPITCNVVSNFVFLKTHKTGSSTLRSLTCRFGYFRNLSFVLGVGGIIGHLNQVSIKFGKNSSNILPPIGVPRGHYANYKNYNISNIHLSYNEGTLKRIMYPAADLKYFTIIREPSQQWLSYFTYFKKYKRAGLKYDNLSETILPYIKQLRPGKGSFNRQLHDLGIKSTIIYGSPRDLNETIQRLDEKMALVLITEYFDESLLLMKQMFCWNFTDILYVKKRQQPSKIVLDKATRKEILSRSAPDVALYNHFLRVFWRKVEEYGPTFQEDLKTFRNLLNETWDKCIGKAVAEKSPDRYFYIENFLAANSSTFCWALVNSKFAMDVEIVRRQGRLSDKRWKKLE